eukprot:1606307-Pleurochrysis_carterae.AAC.2
MRGSVEPSRGGAGAQRGLPATVVSWLHALRVRACSAGAVQRRRAAVVDRKLFTNKTGLDPALSEENET